jgi:hypothetical protein
MASRTEEVALAEDECPRALRIRRTIHTRVARTG